ncbi:hypothetical protein LTR10_017313 [Elasticomyces elasticus]|uniref:Uncharacterized protein n=1 Tax=Exophiala sideris TaxID=1016849 RepID=A0ABR0JJB9_9EURO|nr:hypothetical protein LTR10_017313 [Elasticomyces elasticus]KAK5034126.1 hypothetical protein LTS07_003046 [Exophiala sideris]KAK5042422.1 hypothetical protein LTR13_001269 [Exophiala sideris]KAK5065504.1 hypothetical protein LTR69_003053 [Exophiala sideris]KAK5186037.1 hypothetical protein LTR44_002086 [Eurotiomycetes sp. CCFEE 6388]
MTRSKSIELPQRTSSRPPSYRSRINQDDIEAQTQAADTVQAPAPSMLSGSAGSVSTSTSNHTTHTMPQNASRQGGTARPNSNSARETVFDKNPYLGRIRFARVLFCLVEVGSCAAVFIGLGERQEWISKNKTLVGIPLLTFGVYWAAELLRVISKLPQLSTSERKSLGGLTYKEWKGIMQILVPFVAATAALVLYPMLWRIDGSTEGLD